MATIIRHDDSTYRSRAATLNLDDLAAQASQCMAKVKGEAAEIVAQAKRQADAIREQAAEEGAQAAIQAVDQMVGQKLAPTLAGLRQAADDLQAAKQEWLSHWESNVVRLALAIAGRIVRSEVRHRPEITLQLVREALELAAGSPDIRLHLHPEDYDAMKTQVAEVINAVSGLSDAEVTVDPGISRGGCRVETRFGTIDQQFESQLKRMEEELMG
jgi:flagellar assembly protein FliH